MLSAGSVLCAAAADLSPATALAYVELLETRRAYLSNLTQLPALPALLLTAGSCHADLAASRFLVDGWLLLRIHDGSGPQVSRCARAFQEISVWSLRDQLHSARAQRPCNNSNGSQKRTCGMARGCTAAYWISCIPVRPGGFPCSPLLSLPSLAAVQGWRD